MPICQRCHTDKPLADFQTYGWGRYNAFCKPCAQTSRKSSRQRSGRNQAAFLNHAKRKQ